MHPYAPRAVLSMDRFVWVCGRGESRPENGLTGYLEPGDTAIASRTNWRIAEEGTRRGPGGDPKPALDLEAEGNQPFGKRFLRCLTFRAIMAPRRG
jgi:hypothetical protein